MPQRDTESGGHRDLHAAAGNSSATSHIQVRILLLFSIICIIHTVSILDCMGCRCCMDRGGVSYVGFNLIWLCSQAEHCIHISVKISGTKMWVANNNSVVMNEWQFVFFKLSGLFYRFWNTTYMYIFQLASLKCVFERIIVHLLVQSFWSGTNLRWFLK
jgi:hypothetical protein